MATAVLLSRLLQENLNWAERPIPTFSYEELVGATFAYSYSLYSTDGG
jgi:hypothetical protein